MSQYLVILIVVLVVLWGVGRIERGGEYLDDSRRQRDAEINADLERIFAEMRRISEERAKPDGRCDCAEQAEEWRSGLWRQRQ